MNEKLLLHICCGPCSIYPVEVLKRKGIDFVGLFYNPNIHPFLEFERRVEALQEISDALDFEVIYHPEGYGLKKWLKLVWSRYPERPRRCNRCYEIRLEETARIAKELNFSCFSSTLLYSIYQEHSALRKLGDDFARAHGIKFYYEDFREGWREGKERARAIGIYMQPYCGCILSEEERYEKRIRKQKERFAEEVKRTYESLS